MATNNNTNTVTLDLLREERDKYNRECILCPPGTQQIVAKARRSVLDRLLTAANAGASPMQLMDLVYSMATTYEGRKKEVGRDKRKGLVERCCAVIELGYRAEYALLLFDTLEFQVNEA